MTETKIAQQKSRFRVIHVPRELSFTKKVKNLNIKSNISTFYIDQAVCHRRPGSYNKKQQ